MSNLIVTNVNGQNVSIGQVKAFGSFAQWYVAGDMPSEYPVSGSIGDTLNISSFTDVAEGRVRGAFVNVMSNGKYATNCTTHLIGFSDGPSNYDQRYSDMSSVFNKTTAGFDCGNAYVNGTARDGFYAGIAVHGGLA